VRAELERTERLYRRGVAGIEHLPRDCQFPVLLAAVLYAEHHRPIRAREYDVVSGRPSLSTPRKLAVLVRTAYHWWQSGDPETAFYAASAVPRENIDGEAVGTTGSRILGALTRARDGVRRFTP
jgi:phytoene synthase